MPSGKQGLHSHGFSARDWELQFPRAQDCCSSCTKLHQIGHFGQEHPNGCLRWAWPGSARRTFSYESRDRAPNSPTFLPSTPALRAQSALASPLRPLLSVPRPRRGFCAGFPQAPPAPLPYPQVLPLTAAREKGATCSSPGERAPLPKNLPAAT